MKLINDLPVITGSSDAADSAFFAGMLITFEYPGIDKSIVAKYFDKHNNLVRHPIECNDPCDFSRDQMVPLVSAMNQGLALMYFNKMKDRHFIAPNGDVLSSSVVNHLKICAGLKPKLLGKLDLILGIAWSSFVDKKHEVNQLLCLCKIAGPGYMKLLIMLKKDLDQNIRDYYCGWRNEPEFGEYLISKIRE
jgi:hypothetical protein